MVDRAAWVIVGDDLSSCTRDGPWAAWVIMGDDLSWALIVEVQFLIAWAG